MRKNVLEMQQNRIAEDLRNSAEMDGQLVEIKTEGSRIETELTELYQELSSCEQKFFMENEKMVLIKRNLRKFYASLKKCEATLSGCLEYTTIDLYHLSFSRSDATTIPCQKREGIYTEQQEECYEYMALFKKYSTTENSTLQGTSGPEDEEDFYIQNYEVPKREYYEDAYSMLQDEDLYSALQDDREPRYLDDISSLSSAGIKATHRRMKYVRKSVKHIKSILNEGTDYGY